MMRAKTIALVAAATLGAAGAVHAADLPARVAPAPYVAPLPVFTWTGAYFGINGGAAFSNETRFGVVGNLPADNGVTNGNRPGTFKNSDDGFTAGGQIGYNYQLQGFGGFGGPGSGIVIGFEADAAYIDSAKTGTFIGNSGSLASSATNSFRSGIDFLGTARGRLGFAFNQFLIYGTGGFAYGDTFSRTAFYTAGNPNQLRFFGSKGDFQTGYTYGGGIEYALPTGSFLNFFKSSAVTLKLEYLRYDLGNSNYAAAYVLPNPAAGGDRYNIRARTEGNIARVGLNYKF